MSKFFNQVKKNIGTQGGYSFLLFGIASILIVILLLGFSNRHSSLVKKPNVVILFADDMGYGDIQSLNPLSRIKTPAIDGLVKSGISFENAHASASVCTPSRYGLLTGRYAFRTPEAAGGIGGFTPSVIEKERLTLASILKDAGYTTAITGKWHLGLNWATKDQKVAQINASTGYSNVDYSLPVKSGPNDFGFDYSFIHPASLDIPPYVFLENGQVVDPNIILTTDIYPTRKENTEFSWDKKHSDERAVYWEKGVWWRLGEMSASFRVEDCLETIVEQAEKFIGIQSAEQPFLLYMPLTGPHTPWLPSNESKGKSGAGLYGDFVMDIDQVVARISSKLEAEGLLDNTLIIFSSDNGAYWPAEEILLHGHDSNKGSRGQKGDVWNGGHRVPLIISWPSGIKKSNTYKGLVSLTDIYATLASLTGKRIPAGEGIDSKDFGPVLAGDMSFTTRENMVHHSSGGMFAIREGDWKYIDGLGSGGFTYPFKINPEENGPEGQLYQLNQDPLETTNLFEAFPEKIIRMKEKLEALKRAR
ncbi:sulfatase family protein [Cyclobacterium marinum]|uniref:sulfatase family protein n=1 Tax=Cyclobacterium marinum TaxID=104 RepID=UPI0011EF2C0D|nr:arylsulfatase [Cyclobacterium marinum]MBI0400504.1 arylsulfatase [Cyclobacterium marinum]